MSRVHHPECRVRVEADAGDEAFECEDAEVWIELDAILIAYYDDDGMVVLDGRPDEAGGYELSARSRPRRAILRPMADAPGVYEGEIDEHGEVKAWRLTLGPPETS